MVTVDVHNGGGVVVDGGAAKVSLETQKNTNLEVDEICETF